VKNGVFLNYEKNLGLFVNARRIGCTKYIQLGENNGFSSERGTDIFEK